MFSSSQRPKRRNGGRAETALYVQRNKKKIFNNDLNALKTSDLTVALLTGQDIDSGTAAEIGFSYANKKPIIAITASERRFRNLFVEGMIDKTIDEIDILVDTVKSLDI